MSGSGGKGIESGAASELVGIENREIRFAVGGGGQDGGGGGGSITTFIFIFFAVGGGGHEGGGGGGNESIASVLAFFAAGGVGSGNVFTFEGSGGGGGAGSNLSVCGEVGDSEESNGAFLGKILRNFSSTVNLYLSESDCFEEIKSCSSPVETVNE